ncbi:hypothetical protein [Rufibacter tibetensis]|uniref:hypothetical protein n=1 Tax=Rufibacter tibetensis TaxID=512763 RepID=UPI0007825666|nr:hypothetical protein [Rufibacter tibetensis]
MPTLLSASSWFKASTFALITFMIGATACQDETTPRVMQSTHQAYDLIGFLNKEAQALSAQKAAARKKVSTPEGSAETKTFPSLNWSEELAPFADADINKPALKGLFDEQVTTNALGQQVRTYKAKEDASTNVKEVTYTLDAQGQLVQLDATIAQENMLFRTQKQMHLKVQAGSSPSLTRYRLDETQKLLLMGADHYSVMGEVVKSNSL